MVLYESHSILHGRPFPLKGRFYANGELGILIMFSLFSPLIFPPSSKFLSTLSQLGILVTTALTHTIMRSITSRYRISVRDITTTEACRRTSSTDRSRHSNGAASIQTRSGSRAGRTKPTRRRKLEAMELTTLRIPATLRCFSILSKIRSTARQ